MTQAKTVTLKYVVEGVGRCCDCGRITIIAVLKNGAAPAAQPAFQSDEEIMAQKAAQAMKKALPFIQIGGPAGSEHQTGIRISYTRDQYEQLGRPTYGDVIVLQCRKARKTEAL